MYDEVMQLIALAKNDEVYFKRIEELKAKQLELAQVTEIAKTLGEADKHLALARQKAESILEDATKEAEKIVKEAESLVADNKVLIEKSKKRKADLDVREESLTKARENVTIREQELEKAIKEHRSLTALRSEEHEKALKVRKEFEDKLRMMREIANS